MKGFLLISMFVLSSSFAIAKTEKVIIDHYKTSCVGEGRHSCFRIKYKGENWGRLYSGIQGFDYEWGYRYELLIRISNVRRPPEDGSSKKYTLIKQLKKEEQKGEEFTLLVQGEDAYFGMVSMLTKRDDFYYLMGEAKINNTDLSSELLDKVTKEGVKVTFRHSGDGAISVVSIN